MNANLHYGQVFNNPALLQEWITANYGDTLAFGGTSTSWRLALRHAKHIARMTHRTAAAVVAEVVESYKTSH